MNTVIAFLIGVASISFFYFIFYRAYILAFGKTFIKKYFTKKIWIILGIITILGFLACIFSLSKNSFIYYWDYGGYWTYSFDFMNTLYESPSEGINLLWESILNSDYNMILPLIISLPLKIFGITFTRYVAINYFMFFVPAIFVAFSLFIKLSRQKTKICYLTSFLILLTFVAPFKAMLMGYIDIALLIPIFLLFALTIDFNPTNKLKKNLTKNIFISIIIIITFLFRRYSAFFLIGFIISFCLVELIKVLRNNKKTNYKVVTKRYFINFAFIGIAVTGIMLIFFFPMIHRVLSDNYSEMYAGYDTDLFTKIESVIKNVGWIFIGLSLFGVIRSFYTKTNRKITLISLFSIILICFLFFRVQRMDPHHFYTILAPVMILSYLGLYHIFSIKKSILTLSISALALLNPIYFFSATAQEKLSLISPLFGSYYKPLHRSDIASLKELEEYLKNNTSGSIFVLASSGILNADIVRSMDKPYKKFAIDRQLTTYDVDLRDGFHPDFLKADIVVATTPTQTHLSNGSQEIISYLSEQIQNKDSYIGKHFRQIPISFNLDSNVQAILYQKISDFSDHDLKQLSDYYMNLYPSHPELFQERILPSTQ